MTTNPNHSLKKASVPDTGLTEFIHTDNLLQLTWPNFIVTIGSRDQASKSEYMNSSLCMWVSFRSVVVPVKKTSAGSLAVNTVGSSSNSAGVAAGSTPNIFASASTTPKSMINTTGRPRKGLCGTLHSSNIFAGFMSFLNN